MQLGFYGGEGGRHDRAEHDAAETSGREHIGDDALARVRPVLGIGWVDGVDEGDEVGVFIVFVFDVELWSDGPHFYVWGCGRGDGQYGGVGGNRVLVVGGHWKQDDKCGKNFQGVAA